MLPILVAKDAQEKELKLRDKMVKATRLRDYFVLRFATVVQQRVSPRVREAFGLARQQKNEIGALEGKKTYQEEALKWVQDCEVKNA